MSNPPAPPPATPPGPVRPAVPRLEIPGLTIPKLSIPKLSTPQPLGFEMSQITEMEEQEERHRFDDLGRLTVFSAIRTQEAIVQFMRDPDSPYNPAYVIKNYLDSCHGVIDRYRLQTELHWYLVKPIPWMPTIVRYERHSGPEMIGTSKYLKPSRIMVTYEGGPIQSFPSRQFVIPYEYYNDLYTWLVELGSTLKEVGVHHRDIHGGNIVMRQVDDVPRFSLIDWTWATRNKNAPHNGFIKGDDDEQITGFLRAIDAYRESSRESESYEEERA